MIIQTLKNCSKKLMVKHQKFKYKSAGQSISHSRSESFDCISMKRLLGCNCCKTAPAAQWPRAGDDRKYLERLIKLRGLAFSLR
jgi:hypothetical protein